MPWTIHGIIQGMLETLVIRNLAVIESATLNFSPGLTVLTGSTGGGKSLVVLALKLVRGEKASASYIRTGASRCSIDAVFRLGKGERSDAVRDLVLQALGQEVEDELILSRVVEVSGRSRAYVQSRPVTLSSFQRIGSFLLEIHGQGESAMLFRPSIQAEILDHYAGSADTRREFGKTLQQARELKAKISRILEDRKVLRDKIDLLSFHIKEIESLAPEPGELARLEGERRILANVEKLRDLLEGITGVLSQGESNVVSSLGRAETMFQEACSMDPSLAEGLKQIEEAYLLVKEADSAALSRLHSLEADPSRLEWIEERLQKLRHLCMKFGRNEGGLIELKEEMEKELEELESMESGESSLFRELESLVSRLRKLGRKLTGERRKAGKRLEKEIHQELKDLGMEKARLFIEVGEPEEGSILEKASMSGPGNVEFLLQPNPGEKPKPISMVASGGERARVMLALKKRLADADTVPVVVFDEIDAEVGARIGDIIGKKIKEVSRFHQVVCVTHLPQVAAFGDTHFLVKKVVEGERTFSRVEEITGIERDREIAEMGKGKRASKKDVEEAGKLRRQANIGE